MVRRGPHWVRALPFASAPTGHMGVIAALVIAVLVNLLGARFDRRWDMTSDRRYTPSVALKSILDNLQLDVSAVVLLARSDPLATLVGQLLSNYRTMTPHLTIDWVDPDRDPARFLSKRSELGLSAGHTADGNVASDAILVVSRQSRRYYIEAQDVVGLDPDAGDSTNHFEHAFAVALRTVLEQSSPTVCFTEGHRELSTSDRSPLGLSRLKERLEHETVTTQVVDLAKGEPDPLASCRLVVVAAPDVALSADALHQLTRVATRSSLLLLGGVVPDAEGRLTNVGFEPLARLVGIRLGTDVVVEQDDAFRLPNLFGETFLSTPSEHAATRGLIRGNGESPLRVVVSLAQSLEKEPGSPATTLLFSSPKSVALKDVSQPSIEQAASHRDGSGSRIVAAAGPILGTSAEACRLAVAPANIVQNRSFETPSLLVTQSFGMSLISWLLAPKVASIEFEPRPARPAGFELSAQELSDIARYTVVVMPSCFFLAGMSVLWLRRRQRRQNVVRSCEGSDE